ncbi:ufm1-specific protease 2 [Pristis pectinata]|uniref:ufm1-specific protease 2 n=1 Tax=Pristis pectinata TaxID=685728 RepID=UPI00223E08CA|nr:ufm1-specific protease 2 [Pristis pectinata]
MLPLDSEDLLFRVKGGINLDGFLNKTDEKGIIKGFSDAISHAINKVNSQAVVLFCVESSLFIWPISHVSTQPSELHENSSCKSIFKFVPIEVNDYLKKIPKKKSLKIEPVRVINLELLFEMTRPGTVESVFIQHDAKSRVHFKMTLPIDVVVFANPEDPWGRVLDQIVESISSQLTEMEKCIQRYAKGQSVPIPQAFHFELPEQPTLTTVIYPAGISDEELEPQRKEIHEELGLNDKPYFRRTMAYNFPNDELMNKYLRNIHQYIFLPDAEEYQIHLVHGSYNYHHYLQDGVNDTGWGCAYRALQTITSWYKFQGYITIDVPSHEEIQKRLVQAGEKPPDFVGSSDWIGSFELQAVLNTMDITSKILSIQQGSEFALSARELSEHFDVQGSPVMAGSETLAHILLGIAWNEKTGVAKFLVLDTHYTGEDDWHNAIEKGVDWKDEDFWVPQESYNLCLPQRPVGV